MRVTGPGWGRSARGDTLMNVGRWSASTGWKPTLRTRWSPTGMAAGRHPGKRVNVATDRLLGWCPTIPVPP